MRVRRLLTSLGHRFSQNEIALPGSPDFANVRRRLALFVHGCFWHQHRGCIRATVPKKNRAAWMHKFSQNRRRDRRTILALRRQGYRVLVLWECEIEDMPRTKERLKQFISGG
jgi:DNA mismatch endonuclease (patch repair protein)